MRKKLPGSVADDLRVVHAGGDAVVDRTNAVGGQADRGGNSVQFAEVSSAVADTVIAALVPSSSQPVPAQRVPALPTAELISLLSDGSLCYEISRVDSSGRLSARRLLRALCWSVADQLSLQASAGVIVLRPAAHGVSCVTRQRGVVLPAAARFRCGLQSGDGVLLAAALHHNALVVHAFSVLDLMMSRYHSAHVPASQ